MIRKYVLITGGCIALAFIVYIVYTVIDVVYYEGSKQINLNEHLAALSTFDGFLRQTALSKNAMIKIVPKDELGYRSISLVGD